MNITRHALTLLVPLSCFLGACASQPTGESADGFRPIEVAYDDDKTVIYPVNNFNIDLLDSEYQCRLWAFGRDGRNMRPCAGEVPSCGAPIPFSQVTVVSSAAVDRATGETVPFGDSSLVTNGTYRARIQATVQDTSRYLARQIAREGCDLLVLEGEEWVSIRRGNPVRYLQVRWGSTAEGALDQAAP